MKEQWKKLDSDAKLIVNVEEGRSQPIKIELPLSAISQDKGCCKNLLVTLRIIVLLVTLVLLSWTAFTLYTNYHPRFTLMIDNDETPANINEGNKLAFRSKIYEEDNKNSGVEDVLTTESIHKASQNEESKLIILAEPVIDLQVPEVPLDEVDSLFSAKSDITELKNVLLDKFMEELRDLTEKVEEPSDDSEESKNNIKGQESRDDFENEKNEQEALEPVLSNQWLHGLGAYNLFGDINKNPKLHADLHRFIEDSEEISNADYHKIVEDSKELPGDVKQMLKQVIDNNQDALETFLDDFVNAFESEIEEQIKQSEDESKDALDDVSEKSQVSSANESTVKDDNSLSLDKKSENNNQEHLVSIPKIVQLGPDEQKEKSIEESLFHFRQIEVAQNENPAEKKEYVAQESIHQEETYSQESVSQETTSIEDVSREASINEMTTTSKPNRRELEQQDVFLLMARRLEALVGPYGDLLVYYYKSRNNPITKNDDKRLKLNAATLLFGTNFGDFATDYVDVLSLIMDGDYFREYEMLRDPTQKKMDSETYSQDCIINRLATKVNMEKLFQTGEQNVKELIREIENMNMIEIWLNGYDPNDIVTSEEKSKVTEETFQESSEETDEQRRAFLLAMRKVADFANKTSNEESDKDSEELKKKNKEESSQITTADVKENQDSAVDSATDDKAFDAEKAVKNSEERKASIYTNNDDDEYDYY